MRGRVAAFIVAATMVALLGGCGGDDAPIETISTEAETTAESGTSQEDFIVSADARCAEANAALANLSTDISSTFVSERLGIVEEVLGGVQGLGATDDPDGHLADYVKALESQVSLLEEQQTAAASGDTATYGTLATELDTAEAEAQAAGAAYGFEECGQPPSASTGGSTTPGGVAPAGTTATTPTATTPVPVEPVVPAPEVPPPAGGTAGGGEVPAPTPEPEPEPSGGSSSGGFSP